MLCWCVEAVAAARRVTRVVVSTDDLEIAGLAKRLGTEVVHRPAALSGDRASSESAVLHCLDQLRGAERYEPVITVLAQCTSPLTLPDDVDGTIRALLDANADSAFTVTPNHAFLWQQGSSGEAVAVNHEATIRLRRQEREPDFRETGAVYAIRTAGFVAARHRFFGRTVMFVVPPERSVEIDGEIDLEIAEALMRRRGARNLGPHSGHMHDKAGAHAEGSY